MKEAFIGLYDSSSEWKLISVLKFVELMFYYRQAWQLQQETASHYWRI